MQNNFILGSETNQNAAWMGERGGEFMGSNVRLLYLIKEKLFFFKLVCVSIHILNFYISVSFICHKETSNYSILISTIDTLQ